MKVVILAGGLGTRLSEYTKSIPKPMVKINGKPILLHIIEQALINKVCALYTFYLDIVPFIIAISSHI